MPQLRMLDAQLHNSYNYNAFVHVTREDIDSEQELIIPLGTEIARARRREPREPIPSHRKQAERISLMIDDSLPFAEGGPPVTDADFDELGLDLSMSIDPLRPKKGGGYHKLTDEQKKRLREAARRWWWVFARDARAPETSRLIVLDIPTGDAPPIAQKPYPIPYQD